MGLENARASLLWLVYTLPKHTLLTIVYKIWHNLCFMMTNNMLCRYRTRIIFLLGEIQPGTFSKCKTGFVPVSHINDLNAGLSIGYPSAVAAFLHASLIREGI